jgi:hypothetical protein
MALKGNLRDFEGMLYCIELASLGGGYPAPEKEFTDGP